MKFVVSYVTLQEVSANIFETISVLPEKYSIKRGTTLFCKTALIGCFFMK